MGEMQLTLGKTKASAMPTSNFGDFTIGLKLNKTNSGAAIATGSSVRQWSKPRRITSEGKRQLEKKKMDDSPRSAHLSSTPLVKSGN